MSDLGELLRGIAAVLWPVVVLCVIFLFRAQLRELMGRVRHARFPGGEVDLTERLDALESQTEGLEALPPSEGPEPEASNEQAKAEGVDKVELEVLETAAASPKAGLMLLSLEIEKAMRRILFAVGHPPGNRGIAGMSRELRRVAGLTSDVVSAALDFLLVRSLIIHGHSSESENVALRAIDSGLKILRALSALPYERHIVTATDLPIYRDAAGTDKRHDVKGVQLAAMTDEATEKLRQVFPTTLEHLSPGQSVSWEWNMDHRWDESFYRDPESGEMKLAWSRSVEFVGRPLDEL